MDALRGPDLPDVVALPKPFDQRELSVCHIEQDLMGDVLVHGSARQPITQEQADYVRDVKSYSDWHQLQAWDSAYVFDMDDGFPACRWQTLWLIGCQTLTADEVDDLENWIGFTSSYYDYATFDRDSPAAKMIERWVELQASPIRKPFFLHDRWD